MTERGKFIAMEGIDGAGTTTQTAMLVRYLGACGMKAYATREPSDGPIGKVIREALGGRLFPNKTDHYALQLLFTADRADHLASEIEPALESGLWVVSDRYDMSTLAYGDAALKDELKYREMIEALEKANFLLRRPDLVLFLRVTAEEALKRVAARSGKRDIFENLEFQKVVEGNYDKLTGKYNSISIVDGNLPVEQVHTEIIKVVDELRTRQSLEERI